MNQSPSPRYRLDWLDLLRMLCAIQIAGIHWLRACMHADLFVNTSLPENFRNFIWSYQNNRMGFQMLDDFPRYFLLDDRGDLAASLTNSIGYLFGFGWQALNVFILISGFSLTLRLVNRPDAPKAFWPGWCQRRYRRILFPYYTIVVVLFSAFGIFYLLVNFLQIPFFESIQGQMEERFSDNWLSLLISHFLLIDPWNQNWGPTFFASSWWFLPSILAAYLVFPLLFEILNRFGSVFLLFFSFFISVSSYWQAGKIIWLDNPVFFILTRELFNFCLGMVFARLYQNDRSRIENRLFSPLAFSIGIALTIAGNIFNWFPAFYPFSSIFFTSGWFLVGANLARSIVDFPYIRKLKNVDSYLFYLLHQPFAYLVAIALAYSWKRYTPFFGIFFYLIIVLVITTIFSRSYKKFGEKISLLLQYSSLKITKK